MMLKRFWRSFQFRLRVLNPNDVLINAQREISRIRGQHHDRCVQAITQRINLQQTIKSTERRIAILKAEAGVTDDMQEAERLQKEIEEQEKTLAASLRCLEQARSRIEEANAFLRREEARLRQETTETLSRIAGWNESAILREMRREWKEYSPAIERYQRNPCRETFAALEEMHEAARQKLAQSEQACNDLTLVASRLEATIGKLRRKVGTAEAEGDEETALHLNLEQVAYEKLLISAREAAPQASESLRNLRIAFARQEAYMMGETSRIKEPTAPDDA